MTVSNALSLLEVEGTEVPSLFCGDDPIDVSVVTEGLTDQQTQWVREVKMLDALRAVAGMERAKRLKWIRDDRFPEVVAGQGGRGGNTTRPGWSNFLRAEFDLRPDDANYEIRGLESWEVGKTLATTTRVPGSSEEQKLGSTHLQEIGRLNGKGAELVKRLLERPDPKGRGITQMAIRQEAKALKEEAKRESIQAVAPPVPKAARPAVNTKLPAMAPPEGGTTYSRSKWRKLPVVAERCEEYRKDVEKIRATAVAYKNAVAKLNKRLDEAQFHDRSWPSLMTMFAEFWKEEHDFDFDAELGASQTAISEAQRLYDLSMPRCHAPIRMVD